METKRLLIGVAGCVVFVVACSSADSNPAAADGTTKVSLQALVPDGCPVGSNATAGTLLFNVAQMTGQTPWLLYNATCPDDAHISCTFRTRCSAFLNSANCGTGTANQLVVNNPPGFDDYIDFIDVLTLAPGSVKCGDRTQADRNAYCGPNRTSNGNDQCVEQNGGGEGFVCTADNACCTAIQY